MRKILSVAAWLVVLAGAAWSASGTEIHRTFGSDNAWHVLRIDAVTGLPSDQCYMSDGVGNPVVSAGGSIEVHLTDGAGTPIASQPVKVQDGAGNAIDSRTGALAVALEDGSGNAIHVTGAAPNGSLDVTVVGAPVGGVNANIFDSAHGVLTAVAGRLTVDGSGVTQPISAVALPLPAGASTEATLATRGTEATLATRASEATVATLCTQATCALDATEATLLGVCTQATCSLLGTEVTLGTRASEATLATVAGDTTSIDGKTPALGAALTVASTPVNIASDQTVPVSAAALPLPAGAATEATLLGVCTQATCATLATEATALVIAGDTTSIDGKTPALGAALTAASTPVNIASDQTVPISAAALPLPAGAATAANQLPDGHNVTVDNAGAAAAVNVQDGGNSLTVDGTFWQATQPISAAALPLPAGASTEATLLGVATDVTALIIAGDTTSIDGKITACNTGAVTVSTALPTGANTIGKVHLTDGSEDGMIDNGAVYDGLFVRLTDGTNVSSLSATGDLEVSGDGGVALATSANQTNGTQIAQARLYDGAGTAIDSRTNALAVALEDGSGNLQRAISTRPMPSSVPFLYDVGTAVTTSAKYPLTWPTAGTWTTIVSGFNAAVGNTPETIWPESALYQGFGAATNLNVCSTDADDDGSPAGTGAQTVTIYGMLGSGSADTETITMDGQTAVATVNQYLFLQQMIVATAGSSYRNEGIIYAGTGACVGGKPATMIYQLIPADMVLSQSAMIVSMNSAYAFVTSLHVSADTTAAKCAIDIVKQPYGGLQYTIWRGYLNGTNLSVQFAPPLVGAAKVRFEVRAACDSSSAIAATLMGWQE